MNSSLPCLAIVVASGSGCLASSLIGEGLAGCDRARCCMLRKEVPSAPVLTIKICSED